MSRFLAIHPLGSDVTVEAATPMLRSIKAHVTPDAYWVDTIYVPEAGTAFCTWDAVDADAIRKVLAESAPDLPVEGPYPITLDLHAEDFR